MEFLKVKVRYDSGSNSLTFEDGDGDGNVTLEAPDDQCEALPTVTWEFEGIDSKLAEGYTPGVRFEDDPFRGPFTNLCKMTTKVTGSGNTGKGSSNTEKDRDYSYHVTLTSPEGELPEINSETRTLTNEVDLDSEDTSPVVDVYVKWEDSERKEIFEVTVKPFAVARATGQTVCWRFNLPDDDVARSLLPVVVFDDRGALCTGPSFSSDSPFGPFASWESGDGVLIGAGHRSSTPGRYTYRFVLVNSDGEEYSVKKSPDPVVDDEGDPSGT